MKKNDVINVWIKSRANGEVVEEAERVIPVGRGYVIKAVDESLLAHNISDEYSLEVSSKDAYGPRSRELIKLVPGKYFIENNVSPVKGLIVNIDGLIGKVISTSPGRVMVDFNHPLSGKDMSYEIKIKNEVNDVLGKAKAVIKALIPQELEIELRDKELIINDVIGLPESVKSSVEKELKEVIGDNTGLISIKFISKK